MSSTAILGPSENGAPHARSAADRRIHKRVQLNHLGRFMRANKSEYPCRMRDISVGGASISAPVDLEMGERVVALFDGLGVLEGHVVRLFDGGFAMAFVMTEHRREKLAATLMFLVNKAGMPGIEGRRHERSIPVNNSQQLLLPNDFTIDCRVIDVSLSGASIETVARPPLDSEVKLGSLRARVVRHHETGIAVRFIDVQPPTAIRRFFG
ncbi:MAG TPA: PilZ domain-containing protein [Hyphomicrobiaceae bacterium]|nr:PilZ domain-containing protein [Hyphomicrobiaceae bacterium]